ncbi:MAG: hypothetical protein KJ607_11235 [Bacteroidetes bacterium]|nr:hypothetical protein [Bacteroidota bacterium]
MTGRQKKEVFVIEYDLNGYILRAGSRFCTVSGLSKNELEGRHHSEFNVVFAEETGMYNKFWEDLSAGVRRDEVSEMRIGDICLRLSESYVPIKSGKTVEKVICYATRLNGRHCNTGTHTDELQQIRNDLTDASMTFPDLIEADGIEYS